MFINRKDIHYVEDGSTLNEFFTSLEFDQVPAEQLLMIRATFAECSGHGFHYHEAREEIIYVLEGQIEQWVEKEMKILGPGDVAFIPAGVVHASFNVGEGPAKLLAVLGNKGAEVPLSVDVSDQVPWADLRG